MIGPKDHINEQLRLKELESFSILDTLPDQDYDNLTSIAAQICGTPISLVSLIDNKRQWFKSHHGLNVSETPKEYAFCAHAINNDDKLFLVKDAREDERFYDNPLVTDEPYVIFYAGIPLVTDEGLPLGTLCVIDHEPKVLDQSQINALKSLSVQVMNLLRLRKSKMDQESLISKLESKNRELEQFANVAAHDLKSPLHSITSLASLFRKQYSDSIDDDGKNILRLIEESSEKLSGLIEGLLRYSKSEDSLKEEKSLININTMVIGLSKLFSAEENLSINSKSPIESIIVNKTALDQILINLVANAIKYNDKEKIEIEIDVDEDEHQYIFIVKDNGPGIKKEYQERIFNIFEVFSNSDRYGKSGNGIGLSTVKKVVELLGGRINVESEIGHGAKFIFTLEK
jgi:signal transduction histidine kinase